MKATLATRCSSLSSPASQHQMLLPESVVTSNSREKSSGHRRRAASTVCSFTSNGVAFDWVYGAYLEWENTGSIWKDEGQRWSSPSPLIDTWSLVAHCCQLAGSQDPGDSPVPALILLEVHSGIEQACPTPPSIPWVLAI